MILTNRLFERVAPNREAKSIYIFCEGAKREFDYFEYFRELDSRINIEVYKLHPHEDNSPSGLLNIAEKCKERKDWHLTLSNPCFEVWLYYHCNEVKPKLENMEKCSVWKKHVNSSFLGGFDSRKHPIFIETASLNAEKNFKITNKEIETGCTEVFNLANSMIPLLKSKIEKALTQI